MRRKAKRKKEARVQVNTREEALGVRHESEGGESGSEIYKLTATLNDFINSNLGSFPA